MDGERLFGEQYVRLAPGAAERIAPYLGTESEALYEVVLDLIVWPEEVHPLPRRGRNGLLIAGDPILLDANEEGVVLAGELGRHEPILVRWTNVREIRPLQRTASRC